jgi:hypothetical protein
MIVCSVPSVPFSHLSYLTAALCISILHMYVCNIYFTSHLCMSEDVGIYKYMHVALLSVVKIIAESLSQHDEKLVVPTPLSVEKGRKKKKDVLLLINIIDNIFIYVMYYCC